MIIIGIDPGISGSICFFEDGKIVDIIEMPNMAEGKKNKRQVNGHQMFNELSYRIKKYDTHKINVVVEQPEFLCTKFSKHKKIDGSKIHKDDIEFLLKEAKKQLILNDKTQSIIHIFNYNYVVDSKTFVEEPIGVYADLLTHEMTFITTKKNNLKNI